MAMKSILDPTFEYVPAVKTDIRKTFAKARRKIKGDNERERQQKVTRLPNLQRNKA